MRHCWGQHPELPANWGSCLGVGAGEFFAFVLCAIDIGLSMIHSQVFEYTHHLRGGVQRSYYQVGGLLKAVQRPFNGLCEGLRVVRRLRRPSALFTVYSTSTGCSRAPLIPFIQLRRVAAGLRRGLAAPTDSYPVVL